MELIEFVETPLGALVHGCSRFRPATALTCGRACASKARCDLAKAPTEFELDDADEDTAIDLVPCPPPLADFDPPA